jgi:hypothetical protein
VATSEKFIYNAVKIVRPEDWEGYLHDLTRKHLWQHVAACRSAIIGAVEWIAGPFDPASAGGGARQARERKVRKWRAVSEAGNILCDFGNRGPPTTTKIEDGGALHELATVLYEATTEESGGEFCKRNHSVSACPDAADLARRIITARWAAYMTGEAQSPHIRSMKRRSSSNRPTRESSERDEHDTNFAEAVVRLPRRGSGPLADDEWDELFALRKRVINRGSDFSGVD